MSNSCDENVSGDFSLELSDKEERNNMMMLMAINYQRRKIRFRNQQPIHGGSTSGRRYIDHDRVAGNDRLINDYFCLDPVYGANLFRRRFRMHRPLFLRIFEHLQQEDDYFVQKYDATGQLGLSGLQNMTVVIWMLTYGMAADAVDEYVRIAESTTIECLKKFYKGIIDVFGQEYLRSPNASDIQMLLNKREQRGFPGMLGSLDCMHWEWKNCPTAYHGLYTGHTHRLTIVLEVVASYDLWIWHVFFGMLGSNNDINVLDAFNVFADLRDGSAPAVNYIINGHEYTTRYYLTDGIYPPWTTIVQIITDAINPKKRHFTKKQ